ncbi:hypothetical protein Gotur_024300 [Gossypium turneri]
MAATRSEFEKFDGETNFNLWQVRMMAILVQSGLKKVVTEKKPENLNKTEWVCNPVVPREYGIAGGIDGEDLICLVEKVRNSFCD